MERKRDVLVDGVIIATKREFVVCMVQTVRGGGGPIVKQVRLGSFCGEQSFYFWRTSHNK